MTVDCIGPIFVDRGRASVPASIESTPSVPASSQSSLAIGCVLDGLQQVLKGLEGLNLNVLTGLDNDGRVDISAVKKLYTTLLARMLQAIQ